MEKQTNFKLVKENNKTAHIPIDLFSVYAEYILREAGLEEDELGLKLKKETLITCAMLMTLS